MIFFDDKMQKMGSSMGKRSPKGEHASGPTPMKPEIVKSEDGEVDGRMAAAEDMIAAFHEKSPMKLMEALANFIDMHALRPDDSE